MPDWLTAHTLWALGRGRNYIEVDVDVGSSRSAANVVGLVQGALKSLVIDLAVLLEGHAPASVPSLPWRLPASPGRMQAKLLCMLAEGRMQGLCM